MGVKKVIITVTNDLVTDQRVHKEALTLMRHGYEVLLVGRQHRQSLPLVTRPYHTRRLKLLFEKGFLFYSEYNLRLFFLLLFQKADTFLSVDLDTLVPNFLVSKIKHTALVFDSHEYFTGVPELLRRPFVKSIWKNIERIILPQLKKIITVNESLAAVYRNEYGIQVTVVRNVPLRAVLPGIIKSRSELSLPTDKKIILYQGAVNADRGIEEAVEAMQYIDGALLLIIGDGDIRNRIHALVESLQLGNKVKCTGAMPFEELQNYTAHADVGLSIEKNTNLNYYYSLPNKFFDYIHAGVPVLFANLPEMNALAEQYNIGLALNSHNPLHVAKKIKQIIFADASQTTVWKSGLKKAAEACCWEKEETPLMKMFC